MKKVPFLALFIILGAFYSLFAMSVRAPSFEDLVGGAEQVLRTEVLGTRCAYKGEGANRRIVTFVKLRVEKVVVGEAPAELELEILGGQIGEEGLEVGGLTQFQKGDRDILFVTGNGKYFCPLVAVNYGRYYLVPNAGKPGEFVSRADNTPLGDVRQVSREIEHTVAASTQEASTEALSVEAFEAKIASCAKGLKKSVVPAN